MHVALVNLTGGGLSGGYRKYLRHLVPLLRDDPRVRELNVLLPDSVADAVPQEVEPITWPVRDGWLGYPRLRRRLRRLAPDVVFVPTARWIDCGPIPVVTMVRNMEPLTIPGGPNRALERCKNLVRARAARVACARSARVIAVSGFVREHLVEQWRLPPERVATVYHGVDTLPASEHRRPKCLEGVPAGRYLFTAGSIRPARGIEDALEAMGRTPSLGLPLVIAGEVDPGAEPYRRRLDELVLRHGLESRVIWTGHLEAREMAWCYANAFAFVMTSRVEACPNVALEAMAYGTVSVSNTSPPMPEFFRDAALYYTAGDAGALGTEMMRLIQMQTVERQLAGKLARSIADGYSWSATAEQTITQLAAVSAGPVTA